jgi:methylase of polypeptide subunit release factors
VLHLLEALQLLQIKVPGGGPAEARRLSFRALDIEQIGHVYEGLLDHTAKRAAEPFLGLAGTRDKEPELPLAKLEELLAKGESDLVKFLKDATGKSDSALKKSLNVELDKHDAARFRTACQSDNALWKRVEPLAGLVRQDNFGYPVVIPKGSVFVTAGTDRRSSGTHYTPRSLTEPIVQYTLEPLVYVGPAEGKPKGEWKLKSAKELLELKICDMACGSGAFLVQAARYMAERLLEAWDNEKKANPNTPGITPEGMPSTGKTNEALIPDDPAERKTYAMRIIAHRCLYGVDKNPLAAEMAKLSLWLLTLAKDKPFEFLDHSIRCGDSLVGIHRLEQLRRFSLEGVGSEHRLFLHFLDERLQEAVSLRIQLESMSSETIGDVETQGRLLLSAKDQIERLQYAADLLVAAEFGGGSASARKRSRNEAALGVATRFNETDCSPLREEAATARGVNSTFHWPLEFPEVIVRNGGFDCILTNPPFIEGGVITDSLSNLFVEAYSSLKVSTGSTSPASSAKLSLVGLFAERIATLIKPGTPSGFLCPKPFLRNERYWRPREVLLEAAFPIAVFDMPHDAFASASVETCGVVIGKKPLAKSVSHIRVVPNGDDPYGSSVKEIALAETLNDERFTIRIEASSDDLSLVSFLTQQCGAFADFFESRDGVNPGRKDFKPLLLGQCIEDNFVPDAFAEGRPLGHTLEAPESFDPRRHKPTINGRDFTEFSAIDWQGKYLRYATEIACVPEFFVKGTRWSAQLREREHFDRPEKVVSRQTASTLIATLETNRYFPLNNVHVHFPSETNSLYCCRCLLGLLNSTLLRYVYRTRSEETGKVFPQVHISAVRQLPVPKKPSPEGIAALRESVNEILKSGCSDTRRAALDKAVFDLYGLSQDQRDAVSKAASSEEK